MNISEENNYLLPINLSVPFFRTLDSKSNFLYSASNSFITFLLISLNSSYTVYPIFSIGFFQSGD